MTSVDRARPRTCPIMMDDGSTCGRALGTSRICNTHVSRRQRGNPMGSPIKQGNFAGPKKADVPRGCVVEGCADPHYGHGYCINRRNRWLAYGDPIAGVRSRKTRVSNLIQVTGPLRDLFGNRQCSKCKEWLADACFERHQSSTGIRNVCRRCANDARHKLDINLRRQLWGAQGGKCPCGESLEVYGPNAYHVDHDHTCCPSPNSRRSRRSCGKCVRGLLCPTCNVAIGMVGVDPTRLRALADYLIGLKEKETLDARTEDP